MKSSREPEFSCEEIIAMLNELIDGDADPERLEQARILVEKRPECRALYATLCRTIELYRMRSHEVNEPLVPRIRWETVGSDDETEGGPESGGG